MEGFFGRESRFGVCFFPCFLSFLFFCFFLQGTHFLESWSVVFAVFAGSQESTSHFLRCPLYPEEGILKKETPTRVCLSLDGTIFGVV